MDPYRRTPRSVGLLPLLETIWQDARIAVRMLRRAPSVTIPAVVVLALGIGAATALYAVVYAMWLRPLPYPDPDRLLSVTTYFAAYKLDALTSADYGDWQGTRSLGPLAAYTAGNATIEGPAETYEVHRAGVSYNMLDVLRVRPAIGRAIERADDDPQAPRVALLCDGLWRERFGADPGVIGKSLRLDGEPYTVIGVLPRQFRMPDERRLDLLTPLALPQPFLQHGTGSMKVFHGVARLQPRFTIDAARAELQTRLDASRAAEPKLYGGDVGLRIESLHRYAVRDNRTVGILLIAAVVSILLIASANVASLLVARAAARGREIAVRVALGASRLRIARHLLLEGLALAAAGIAGGLLLARALIALLERLRPAALTALEGISINGHVLAVALAVALLCSVVFSLAPAIPVSRLRIRRGLVVGELALSLALLIGASLLLESLAHLRSVTPGFLTERVVAASLSTKGTRYDGNSAELRRELSQRLGRIPGTVAVGFANALPPAETPRVVAFSRADRPLPDASAAGENVVVRLVDERFFEAMGIPLLQGRAFTPGDVAGDGLSAVVNRTLAAEYFRGESALGKQVDGLARRWKTVVGVVADTRNDGLRNPTRPEIYLPMSRLNRAEGGGVTQNFGLNVVVRTAGDPSSTMSLLRQNLHEIDPSLLAKVRRMDEQWAEFRAAPRFQATVFTIFAALALIMASAGIYGVLSHVVVLRRREMGIRMALGASRANIQGLVMREAIVLATAGAAVGIAAALAGSRYIASVLYEVNPRDPVTLAAAAGVLGILAVCASAAPAFRASRQEPAQVLRAD